MTRLPTPREVVDQWIQSNPGVLMAVRTPGSSPSLTEAILVDRERVLAACIEAVSKSDISGLNKAHVYSALRALDLTGQ